MRRFSLRTAVAGAAKLFIVGASLIAIRTVSAQEPDATAGNPVPIGPYVYGVTPTSAMVRWATLAPSQPDAADSGTDATKYEFHEKQLNGLNPGTTTKYNVLESGAPQGAGSVTTFPDGPHPFRFVVYGDTRSRADVHERIVHRAMDEKPLFVVNTGDLVADGRQVSLWEEFFNINRPLLRDTLYLPVLGNHERNGDMFFDVFRDADDQRYKAVTVGDALFLLLDSEAPGVDGADRETYEARTMKYMQEQKGWVEKTLNESENIGFVFPCFHKPLYTTIDSRMPDTNARREFWGDIFERNGVQIVFCGHDHHYFHLLHNGTHYVTSGGGGAPLYAINTIPPESVKAIKIEHIVRVDIGTDSADVTALDIDGNSIDQFQIARRK